MTKKSLLFLGYTSIALAVLSVISSLYYLIQGGGNEDEWLSFGLGISYLFITPSVMAISVFALGAMVHILALGRRGEEDNIFKSAIWIILSYLAMTSFVLATIWYNSGLR